jgi:hypothetical protein
MSAANIIQLRQLLKEKMPALRLGLEELTAQRLNHWPTGVPQIDEPLHGGLPGGALTEMVAVQRSSGSALLRNALLARAAREKQIVALIDGKDSLDVTTMEESVLSRLIWVRCQSADETLKAADLVLRDRNVPLVFLDLISNPATQIRRIPATTWFRFQRIVEQSSTVCLVLTPQPMISPAQARITLQPARFSLNALEREPAQLLTELNLEVSDARRSRELNERLRHSA